MIWGLVALFVIFTVVKLIWETIEAVTKPEGDQNDSAMFDEVERHTGSWAPYAEHLASIDCPDIPEIGRWARFEYVDADGQISNRSVTMWEKRGRYIVGYDRSRKDERTFRQDRISKWICG